MTGTIREMLEALASAVALGIFLTTFALWAHVLCYP